MSVFLPAAQSSGFAAQPAFNIAIALPAQEKMSQSRNADFSVYTACNLLLSQAPHFPHLVTANRHVIEDRRQHCAVAPLDKTRRKAPIGEEAEMLSRRSLIAVPLLAGALAPFSRAARAGDYPSGPVKFIVDFPAGGSLDTITRAIAQQLQPRLGVAVVVEDRPGASGMLGTAVVAKATPDGLTLLSSASSLAANPTLFKSLPFDTLKDLQAISLVFRTPLVLIVNPTLPAHSVKELIELLKQKPDQIDFGHGGPGSAIHLAAELFQTMTGTKMHGISYHGAPPALIDLMADRIALMFADVGSVIAQIKAGRVRALGVTSTERVPALPDVPTIAEAGVTGFDAVGWTLICAPAATPKPIVNELASKIAAATETPAVQALIRKLGMLPVKSPAPPELQAFLASEIERWGKLIQRAGVAQSL